MIIKKVFMERKVRATESENTAEYQSHDRHKRGVPKELYGK
jgi:hypothetical protein